MDDDLERADGVAFVLAHLRNDERLINELLDMHGEWKVSAVAIGVLLDVLKLAGVDAIALERTLVDWQEQRRGSL